MPNYTANFLIEKFSDHNLVKVELLIDRLNSKNLFKYYNVWSSHPDFLDIVKKVWQGPEMRCKMYQVVRKLKILKGRLKELNNKHLRNILTEVDDDWDTLCQIQQDLQRDSTDQELQQKEKDQYQKFRRSSYLDEIFRLQRSKATWIKLGDENTRYFYSIIKHKSSTRQSFNCKTEIVSCNMIRRYCKNICRLL